MTRQEKQIIHEQARKILCKARTLSTASQLAVCMTFQLLLDFIDAMQTDEVIDRRIKILEEKIKQCNNKKITIIESGELHLDNINRSTLEYIYGVCKGVMPSSKEEFVDCVMSTIINRTK